MLFTVSVVSDVHPQSPAIAKLKLIAGDIEGEGEEDNGRCTLSLVDQEDSKSAALSSSPLSLTSPSLSSLIDDDSVCSSESLTL
jgi:hypothetical protein